MRTSITQIIIRSIVRPRGIIETVIAALLGYGAMSAIINLSLLKALFSSVPLAKALGAGLIVIAYGPYAVGGFISAAVVISIALLWGSNIALTSYYIRHSHAVRVATGSGIRGILALIGGVIGTGCWACGGALIAPIISSVAGVASLSALYIGGVAVSGVSIALLVYSMYTMGRAIRSIS